LASCGVRLPGAFVLAADPTRNGGVSHLVSRHGYENTRYERKIIIRRRRRRRRRRRYGLRQSSINVTLRVSACVYRSSIGIVSILNYVVSPSLASFSFRLQGTRIRKISNIFRSASTAHDVINYRNLRLYIYIYSL
jgi:hypothetical protein